MPVDARANAVIDMTTDIVSAYVSNNRVPASELPALIATTQAALVGLGQAAQAETQIEKPTPAQIRKSMSDDALISFIDGKPYKTLKRHLGGHGLTIETYRERYGLPKDYPTTAPGYSAQRSALALSLGLGRPRTAVTAKSAPDTEAAAAPPKTKGRKKAGEVEAVS